MEEFLANIVVYAVIAILFVVFLVAYYQSLCRQYSSLMVNAFLILFVIIGLFGGVLSLFGHTSGDDTKQAKQEITQQKKAEQQAKNTSDKKSTDKSQPKQERKSDQTVQK